MRIRAKRQYVAPAYPIRDAVILDPALLARHVPAAWLRSEIVAGAFGMYLFLAGISDSGAAGKEKGNASELLNPWDRAGTNDHNDEVKAKAAKVAPIFLHGSGHGAEGCIVMTPPVYLSESEAREVIEKEFAASGVMFNRHDVLLFGLSFELAKKSVQENGLIKTIENRVGLFFVDAVSGKSGVEYKFVSAREYLRTYGRGWVGTVQEIDTRAAAEEIRELLSRKGGIPAGVFYDPLIKFSPLLFNGRSALQEEFAKGLHMEAEELSDNKEDAKRIAAKFLRAQVRDFIEWAKREGVLK